MAEERVVAIDGPAGSGKSTVARSVGAALGLPVLETGAMYRAVTWAVLRDGIDPAAGPDVTLLTQKLRIEAGERVSVDGEDVTDAIRAPEVTAAVSVVAAHPGVREVLVAAQRTWIADHHGGVVEGRDIGTVVAPGAALKVYLAATDEERARRRHLQARVGPRDEENRSGGVAATLDDIRRRDRLDSTRAAAPLAVADDAVVLDTTGMTAEDVVAEVVALYEAKSGAKSSSSRISLHKTDLAGEQAVSVGERVVWAASRGIVVGLTRLLWRPRIFHKERLPRRGSFILAPSHRSFLDTPFAACLTRRRIRYMGKAEMWKYRSLGRLFTYLGAFPVERGTADRAAFNAAGRVLSGGEPLVMFPEGTRRSGPIVEGLYDGVAYLALRTGVPIVPVGIGGSERILGRGSRIPRLSRVVLIVGQPIDPPAERGTVRRREVAALTERLRGELQGLFDEAQIKAGA